MKGGKLVGRKEGRKEVCRVFNSKESKEEL
jgi:hypothetical protein